MTPKERTRQKVKQIIKEEIKNHLLLESVLRDINKIEKQIELNGGVINEGIWDTIKYGAGKLGSLQKGGRWSKTKGADEAVRGAEEKLKRYLDKAGNEVAKTLADEIKDQYPEYPNMKDQWTFISATTAIAQAYEGVVAGYKKYDTEKLANEQEEGALDSASANAIIEALKLHVKKTLDYDLADVYKHFTEDEEYNEEQLLEVQRLIEEIIQEVEPGDPGSQAEEEFGVSGEEFEAGEEGYEPEDDDKYLSADEESKTIAALKSRLLPGVLAGLGAGFSGAHLYAMSLVGTGPKLIQLADLPRDEIKEATESFWTNAAIGMDKELGTDIRGFAQSMANAGGGAPQDLVGNIDRIMAETGNTLEQVAAAYAEQAEMGEDSARMFKAVYEWGKQGGKMNAWWRDGAPADAFVDFVRNTQGDDFANLVDQAGSGAGTFKGGLTNLLARKAGAVVKLRGAVLPMVINYSVKELVAGSISVAGFSSPALVALAPAMGYAALTLGLGGGLIMYLRRKGLKDSRAAVLQTVWESLKYLPPHPYVPQVEKCEDGTPKDFEKYPETGCPPEGGEKELCPDGKTPKDFERYPDTGCPPTKVELILPALIVLDNDGLSVFRIKARTQADIDPTIEEFKAIQAKIIHYKSDITSAAATEDRPYTVVKKTWPRPKISSMFIKGRSSRKKEPFVAIDASILTDLGGKGKTAIEGYPGATPQVGLGETRAKGIAEAIFKASVLKRKKLTVEQAREILVQKKVPPKKIPLTLKWLQMYGMVDPRGDTEAVPAAGPAAPAGPPGLEDLSGALADAGADEKTKSFIVQHIATQLDRQGMTLSEAAPAAAQSAERAAGQKALAATKAATKPTAVGTPEEEEAALAGKKVSGEKKPGTTGEPQIAVYSHPAGAGVKRDLKQALIGAGIKDQKILQKLLDIVAAWGKSQNLKINENELCEALYKSLLTESTFARWKTMAGIIKG